MSATICNPAAPASYVQQLEAGSRRSPSRPRFVSGSELWPRLGGVDIALLVPEERPIAIGLKCGVGRDALGPCAWDALKLALALQSGLVSAAYLLAATAAADWEFGHRGAELFATDAQDTLELRER